MGEQKSNMRRGELYLADDPELVEEHARCRRLLERFNQTGVDDREERGRLLHELLGHLGEDAVIKPPFQCDYGYTISVGAGSFINYGAVLLDCAPITIGKDVQMGPNVQLLTPTHPLDADLRRTRLEAAQPIEIGDGAWLGGGVIVCPGVRIGRDTVVGAGSVVTRDIPEGVLAVGNPCRVVRSLSG